MSALFSWLALTLGISSTLAAAPATRPAAPKAVPPAFEGVVLGPDTRPVEAALVTAQRAGLGGMPLSTRTDAKGAFRIVPKASGLYDLRVEKAGLVAAALPRLRPGRPLTVRLEQGGLITGLVLDGTTRQPVVGARVEALEEGTWGASRGAAWEPAAGAIEAVSGARGRFELVGVGLKLMNVSAVAPGYSRATQPNVRVGAHVRLALFPGASISGVVMGGDGRPVAGALVKAEDELPLRREATPRIEITDAQGRFTIAGVAPGRWSVMARVPDMAPAVARVSIETGSDAAVELRIGPGATLVGRLISATGEPVAGRVALQELLEDPAPGSLADALRADAGTDGRFRLEHVPLGSHALAVTARSLTPRRVELTVEADTDLGDIALESGLAIRGRVRDRAGLGIAGAQVQGFRPDAGLARGLEATSEEDGSFAVGGLDPGTYRVSVRAPGYASAERSVEAGAEEASFVLDPAGAIVGCVVDAGGRAVTSYRVDAQAAQEGGIRSRAPAHAQSIAAADGCFRLEDVGEGTWLVSVSAPEHPLASVSNVRVVSGVPTDVGTIRLASGGIARGVVVDIAGGPILGATVSVMGQSWQRPQATTSTGLDGTFELSGLAPGTVDLAATHPEYAEGHAADVEIDPAQGPSEVRIALSAGGRIVGSLRKRDGQPVTGAMVAITPLMPGRAFSFASPALRPLRDDGTFATEHVAPGRYKVMTLPGDRGVLTNSQDRDIDVRESETTTVDFVTRDILVHGRVTRAGQPAPGLRVSLQRTSELRLAVGFGGGGAVPAEPTGPQRLTGTTRDDGAFELLADEPGECAVRVGSLDGKLTFPARTVELPDADSFFLDLAFSGAPLGGVVVDETTSKPVAEASVWVRPKERAAGGGANATTGVDGRFTFELDPGTYTLAASSQGARSAPQEVTLTESGLDGLRLALVKGAVITGRVVDAAGRGVGRTYVMASVTSGKSTRTAGALSLDDGSFRIEGLSEETSTVAAARDGRFAVLPGVTPGDAAVTLTLRPGARAQITVHDANGAPIEGARASTSVDGVAVPTGMPIKSDATGALELAVPAGSVTVTVSKDRLHGRAVFEATEGGVVPVDVVLSSE